MPEEAFFILSARSETIFCFCSRMVAFAKLYTSVFICAPGGEGVKKAPSQISAKERGKAYRYLTELLLGRRSADL